jgi:alpha-tubulin suppressor-like RCC1 family protein
MFKSWWDPGGAIALVVSGWFLLGCSAQVGGQEVTARAVQALGEDGGVLAGSDTLFGVTGDVIAAAPSAGALTYAGGGSGLGELDMATGAQVVAPMSRFLGASACSAGAPGASPSAAAGLVVGLDGITVLASQVNGANTNCNGTQADCNAATDPAAGLAFDRAISRPIHGPYALQGWRDVLAVLFAGQSHAGDSDTGCNSEIRNVLAANYGAIFESTCNGTCRNGESNAPEIQHIFRPDDASGTAEMFASILGLGVDPSRTSVLGQGASPYCNVAGGVLPGSNPPKTQGTALQVRQGGSPVGQVATEILGSNDFLASSYQDNDPIRRICVRDGNRTDFEQVCDLDGRLGLVLPISSPGPAVPTSLAFPTGPCNGSTEVAQAAPVYPRPDGRGRISGRCPNGDLPGGSLCWLPASGDGTLGTASFACLNTSGKKPFSWGNGGPIAGPACTSVADCTSAPYQSPPAGNSTACVVVTASNAAPAVGTCTLNCTAMNGAPGDCSAIGQQLGVPTFTFNCFAANGNAVSSSNPGICRLDPSAADGRVFNKHLYTAAVGNGAAATYQTDSFGEPVVGAFYRIHSTQTLGQGTCTQSDPAKQIGCLVSASPCSLGLGSLEAATQPGVAALKVQALDPTPTCVQSMTYPLWRKLYLNTDVGFGSLTGASLALAQAEANVSTIDPALTAHGFVPLPAGSPNQGAPYCEDFNEAALCGAASNVNACAGNGAVGLPTATTTCGNGFVEAFEECDEGTANGTATGSCSSLCRWVGAPASGCTPGGLRCNGQQPQSCDSTGTWNNSGSVCTGCTACSAGSCQPTTGTACDDGDACTQTDTCQSGVCVGGNPVVCSGGEVCANGACGCPAGYVACTTSCPPKGVSCIKPIALAAGESHVCALLSTGSLECWGTDRAGALGIGVEDLTPFPAPVPVPGITKATAIAAGGTQTCALVEGAWTCWGADGFGEIGVPSGSCNGGTPCTLSPTTVVSGASAFSTGQEATCAVVRGVVECLGDAHYGEIGTFETNTCDCSQSPVPVSGSGSGAGTGILNGVTALSGFGISVCALTQGGSVACWGDDEYGQSGPGGDAMQCNSGPCSPTPTLVSGVTNAVAVATGQNFSCALLQNGSIECWGDNALAELGHTWNLPCLNQVQPCSPNPLAVTGITTATAIAAGGAFACALLQNGSVVCWGDDSLGELGNTGVPFACLGGGAPCSTSPLAVPGVTNAVAITAGGSFACALLQSGDVKCWGQDSLGELGNGTISSTGTPTPVSVAF